MHKSISVIHLMNGFIDKNVMISTNEHTKNLIKIPHPFLIKTLESLGTEETYLSIIKGIYHKRIATLILSGEKFETFPLKLETRQVSTFITPISIQCLKS